MNLSWIVSHAFLHIQIANRETTKRISLLSNIISYIISITRRLSRNSILNWFRRSFYWPESTANHFHQHMALNWDETWINAMCPCGASVVRLRLSLQLFHSEYTDQSVRQVKTNNKLSVLSTIPAVTLSTIYFPIINFARHSIQSMWFRLLQSRTQFFASERHTVGNIHSSSDTFYLYYVLAMAKSNNNFHLSRWLNWIERA